MKFLDRIFGNKKTNNENKEIEDLETIRCSNVEEYIEKKQNQIVSKIKLQKKLMFDEETNKKINEIETFSNEVISFLEKEKEVTKEILTFIKTIEKVSGLEKIEQKEQNGKLLRQREALNKKRNKLIKIEAELNLRLKDVQCVLEELVQIYLKER